MATLTVSLPDTMVEWIEDQVGEEFDDASAYLRHLVARDREERDEERIAELRAIVEEARAGGLSTRTLDEIFEDAVAAAKADGTFRA